LVAEKTNAHGDWIRSVGFNHDGSQIVSGSDDKTIKVWDASSLALVAEKTNAHSDRINSVAVSPDGTKIVSGSNDGTIKAWELRDSPVGERDVVGSKDNLTAIQQAYKEGCTPLLLNGTAVASWEEVGQKLEEIEGDFTIKVWGEWPFPTAMHPTAT